METKLTDEGLNISVMRDKVVGVYIDAYGNYNNARIVLRPTKNEYASISYEWEGKESIPMFVYELMSFIKSSTEKASFAPKDGFYCVNEDLYKEYLERTTDKGV